MDKLGKYIIEEPLGEGGMGMVYRALDPVIGRRVAIKVIHQHVMSPAIKQRFYREAQSVGRLSHENITTLFDVGEHDGDPFLVLELLGGTDLRKRLRADTPLTLAQKLDIAEQICRGLQYAHTNDVIHRDIKPDNIRVLGDGRVKIMDFGLARIESDTLTHSSMGTPRYMSPEQIKDAEVDHRTDIFSFGVLSYEMLSGSNPFTSDHVSAIIYKILNEEPEPLSIDDELLTGGLQQIVTRCIQKDPDKRYQDFDAVLTALASVRLRAADTRTVVQRPTASPAEEPEPTTEQNVPERRIASYAGYVVAAVLIVGFAAGAYLLLSPRDSALPDGEPALDGSTMAVEPSMPELGETSTDSGALVEEETLRRDEGEMTPVNPDPEPAPDASAPGLEAAPDEIAAAADLEWQERRIRADGVRGDAEAARRDARARLSQPENVPEYRDAETLLTRAARFYRQDDFETAARLFGEAQTLYRRAEDPVGDGEQSPMPTPDPSSADEARTGMLAAKDEIPPVLEEYAAYREALDEERRGNNAYAADAFDQAAAHFDRARAQFEEVAALPSPREEVESSVTALLRRFKQSMEAEDADALHALSPFYAMNTWTGFFGVADELEADVDYEIVRVDGSTATVVVTGRLRYLNNKNQRQANQFAYTWTLMRDAPQSWTLSGVQNR